MPRGHQLYTIYTCLFACGLLALFSCAPISQTNTEETSDHQIPEGYSIVLQPIQKPTPLLPATPTITAAGFPNTFSPELMTAGTKELYDSCEQPEAADVWITVFIHGIMNVKPHLSLKNAVRFVTDSVHNTLYSNTIMRMRNDPFFYQNQVMHRIGLVYIDPDDSSPDQHSLRCMVKLFEEIEHLGQPHNKTTNYYYAFGWNGLLSQRARYEAACHLFSELQDELTHLKGRGINARIRLIGYSHGGNVALNLGRVCKEYCEEQDAKPVYIDELVLIGTPIKTENNCLAHSPYFRKVYNFYSLRDKVQQLDLFSHNQMFSRRLFINHLPLIEQNKIVQVQLQVTRAAKSCHRSACNFEQSKQVSFDSIVRGNSYLLRDISPGHTELWFFGWTPLNYRKKYPLYPIPTVAVVPYLLPYLRALPSNKTHVIADIRPEHEFILLKNAKKRLEYTLIPFICVKELERLKRLTLEYAPVNHTEKEYADHVQRAFCESYNAWFQPNVSPSLRPLE